MQEIIENSSKQNRKRARIQERVSQLSNNVSRLELQGNSLGLTKTCFEEPVMTEVSFANTKVKATNVFVIDTIAFIANTNAFMTNASAFAANTIELIIFAIVRVTESMVKRIDTLVSTTMAYFSEMETIVFVLDTTFSFTEKTVGEAPAEVSSHSSNFYMLSCAASILWR
jgi:hypothetical protein